MRRIFLAVILIASALFAESNSTHSMVKFQNNIVLKGKPVVIIFDSKTCPYCERMKKDIVEVDFLHEVAREFDFYRIPRDEFDAYTIFGRKTSTQELQMDYRIKVTPYVVIFDKKGEKVWQIPGYSDPSLFTKILKFVKGLDEGKYKKSEWRQYLYDNNVIRTTKPTQSPH